MQASIDFYWIESSKQLKHCVTKTKMQSEPYKKQKRRLNVYLTKSRIIYGTKFIDGNIRQSSNLFRA